MAKMGLVNDEESPEPCQRDSAIRRPLPASDEGDRRSMKSHTFTLILSGVAEITPELADALYTATHGDVEFTLRDGIARLEFERSALSLRKAITSAIREVVSADVGVL